MRVELGFVKLTRQLYPSLAKERKVIQAPNSHTSLELPRGLCNGPTAAFELINFSAGDYCWCRSGAPITTR